MNEQSDSQIADRLSPEFDTVRRDNQVRFRLS